MKKIIKLFFLLTLTFFTFSTSADYNDKLTSQPIFMEHVYNFISTDDITTSDNLSYCEQVYLEATRRRAYTEVETNKCWKNFEQKNTEEIAYKKYMLNNRELFY